MKKKKKKFIWLKQTLPLYHSFSNSLVSKLAINERRGTFIARPAFFTLSMGLSCGILQFSCTLFASLTQTNF